jgi:hypothetical protein
LIEPDGIVAYGNIPLLEAKGLRPQSQQGLGPSSSFHELIAVVGLRGGSRVTGRLSTGGLANVAVRDWSDDFTFIIGDHCYRCRSYVAQFLSPRVAKLHLIDATINQIRINVDDPDELFGSALNAAGSGRIAVDSAHRRTFAAVCAALWNPELWESICGQFGNDVMMKNVFDRL